MNPSRINSAGLSGPAAIAICGATATGITAAGTASADAFVLTVENNFIGTVAAGAGVRLSVGEGSQKSWVYNGGANAVLVYPPTGGTINGGSVDAGLSLDANKAMAISYASALTVTAIADDITPALITANAIAAGDSSLGIDGQAAAQGGAIAVTGGTSSTANNAGGAVTITGGAPAGTGAGGAVTIAGGASTAGGATGKGGAVNLTGGAAATTNDDGGSIVLTVGAKNGTGLPGIIRNAGIVMQAQATPGTFTTTATLTAAQIVGGILEATHPGGGADVDIVLPAGSVLTAGLPTAMANNDSFELVIINIGTAAAADTYTLIAGSQFTIVGNPIIQSNHATITSTNTGRFRVRKTAADTYVAYRVA